jgi:hypothetical protein
MIIGSKKYHLYKPAIRPTSQPAVVQESSEVLRLKHVKVFWDFALGLGLGSIGLSLIAILSSPFAAVSNGFFFLLYGGIVLTLISIIGTLIVAIKLQKATATSSDSAS